MTQKEKVWEQLLQSNQALTAYEIAETLNIDRSNVSRYLNEYYKAGRVEKLEGRPVRYQVPLKTSNQVDSKDVIDVFDELVGYDESLKIPIQKAKAAILYPPRGLHTIIFGETGTGKSLFAESMYKFALSSNVLSKDAPFVSFNCADYAQNPQLLFGHIFGIKKGAFTGADHDQEGLVAQADGGILFLDEIHRLPPEGQEMLFTFIDKGVYRPLGESNTVKKATVQIIGATTEAASTFLTTFNRRIPMSIELPPLRERSFDERYQIVLQFFMDEAKRLNRNIYVDRDVLLAFILYKAEANIGQVKRDVKLVCAKSFLHYQKRLDELMKVTQEDLPITVQEGLLDTRNHQTLNHVIDTQWTAVIFDIKENTWQWERDDQRFDKKTSQINVTDFSDYVTQLTHQSISETGVDEKLWKISNQIYDEAAHRLEKVYDERLRVALSLHLQTILERLNRNETINNPHVNEIRKQYLKEFQLAMELAVKVEETYHLILPMEEIGYLTLFLTLEPEEKQEIMPYSIQVIVMMHGESTASNMLVTAQKLLGIDTGYAIDMPLDMEVKDTYQQLKSFVENHLEICQKGLLLLTDMGSLNRFGGMIREEFNIPVEAMSMVSTMMVMEALRLSNMGRSLEDINQHLKASIRSLLFSNTQMQKVQQKAIIVTCFTGEGVAIKLQERLEKIVSMHEYKIIPMQYLEKQTFQRHIDEIIQQYDVRAIVGTVKINYQNIPYFSALDLFEDDKQAMFYRLLQEDISINDMTSALNGTLTNVASVQELLLLIQEAVKQMQQDLVLFVEPSVESGIIMHLAFLIDQLLSKQETKQRKFEGLNTFKKENKLAYDTVMTQLLVLSKRYHIFIEEDEAAYITQMLVNNRLDSQYLTR